MNRSGYYPLNERCYSRSTQTQRIAATISLGRHALLRKLNDLWSYGALSISWLQCFRRTMIRCPCRLA